MKETKKTHLLDSIEQFTAENGFPPTIRELCGLMGYHSPSTVHGYVKQLCMATCEIRKTNMRFWWIQRRLPW